MLHGLNFKQFWRSFIEQAHRYKVHLAIALTTVLYILIAPVIYANYFINYGKPIKFNGELPLTSENIKFTIDTNETIIVGSHNYQRITGWAFIAKEVDQSNFEKYLVLNSESRTYYFAYDPARRQDVQIANQHLGINVLQSGFNEWISGDWIRPGTYNIGFLFWNKADSTGSYSVTNQFLIRTPNHISVKIGEKPEVNASGKLVRIKSSLQDGVGINFNKPLPEQTDKIFYYVEFLNRVSINGNSYGRLGGWAFLTGETNQTNYERIITLESGSAVYYFPTIGIARPDVEEVFGNLKVDLSLPGFETYFINKELPYGTYEIGIIFLNKDNEEIYYSKTDSLIIWDSEKFELNRN